MFVTRCDVLVSFAISHMYIYASTTVGGILSALYNNIVVHVADGAVFIN